MRANRLHGKSIIFMRRTDSIEDRWRTVNEKWGTVNGEQHMDWSMWRLCLGGIIAIAIAILAIAISIAVFHCHSVRERKLEIDPW